ncbi:MAG: 5-oxopent-3-ene-1,2,5-tricarboxylate decarboxylase, partial [Hyphomicrobiales bacterium]
MRLATILSGGKPGLAAYRGQELVDLAKAGPGLPGDILAFLAGGEAARTAIARALDSAPAATVLDPERAIFLPVVPRPGKIICVGLNYADHSAESGFKQPDYPTLFGRFATSLIGHKAPLIRPNLSDQL